MRQIRRRLRRAAAAAGGFAVLGLWSWVRCRGAYGSVRCVASCEVEASALEGGTAASDVLSARSDAFRLWFGHSAVSSLTPQDSSSTPPPRGWKVRADCFTLTLDDPVVHRVLARLREGSPAATAPLLCAMALAGSATFRCELCLAALWFGGPLAAYDAFRRTTVLQCVEVIQRFRVPREAATEVAHGRSTTASGGAPLLSLGSWHATVLSREGALIFTPLAESGAGFEGMAIRVVPEGGCQKTSTMQMLHFLAPFDQFDELGGSSSIARSVALSVHTVFCKVIVAQAKCRLQQICAALDASEHC